MSTIHCRDDGLEPSRCWMSGSETFSDELPATISTRLRQRTERVHQRRAWIASSTLVGAVTVLDIEALLGVDGAPSTPALGQPTAGERSLFSGTESRQPFSWFEDSP